MKEKPMVSRRTFLESAGVATGAVVATGAFPHPSLGKVKGANERINIGILGPGGRAQEHIRILNHLKDENKGVGASATRGVVDVVRTAMIPGLITEQPSGVGVATPDQIRDCDSSWTVV